MGVVSYGARFDSDTNFITEIDLDNETCETTGYIDGQAVDFSGGGSSDFSTAEVVLTTGSSDEYLVSFPICRPDCCEAVYQFGGEQENELIVPLYKGKALANLSAPYTVSVTGDADYDVEEGVVTITGNCTVTIS